ncbi:MAG: DegT/DnrJ/EryC1/StrS family aminotransferase [Endomicrobium sp.]|nr:DegT/DnrJ/EryC1/StrS family aminotransferase [Endomicrobium sp.]
MDAILKLKKKYKFKLIEDSCQAHGAEFKKKKVGSFGDAAAFSSFVKVIPPSPVIMFFVA